MNQLEEKVSKMACDVTSIKTTMEFIKEKLYGDNAPIKRIPTVDERSKNNRKLIYLLLTLCLTIGVRTFFIN